MPVPTRITDLVDDFTSRITFYKGSGYNETSTRIEFINPFFAELGWDVDNKNRQFEVVHEGKLNNAIVDESGRQRRAPDYIFWYGQLRRFVVEAKKPAVPIKDNYEAAQQARSYGWSAQVPLAILTDFEEFAIYDTRFAPRAGESAKIGLLEYYRYDEYPQVWQQIADLFSRDAVANGSLDAFVQEKKPARPTIPVDKAFLAEIDAWRRNLAINIASLNPQLDVRQLNRFVQATIDRLIFLRFCENRGIEDDERLFRLAEGSASIYPELVKLYQQADDRYNSGLFHFKKEANRQQSDDADLLLKVGDAPLREIITRLSRGPYAFGVIPVEIIGQVYEQFLGKVITLSSSHTADVEDKPEVRKAGGVYYTPQYIVDYIIEHTVRPLLEGKSVAQVADVKVLDPACGSGSFLIGAYDFLLGWYLDAYIREGESKKATSKWIVDLGSGQWRLRTDEKRAILLRHIYGVDIDTQAVEVTKLSLLLKMLEDDDRQTLQRTLGFERVLPDLDNNIKCGNSLIGPDFFSGNFDRDEWQRVNPFDWAAEFPTIMQAGGFDAVIGNPPYVFGRNWKALNIGDDIKAYLGAKYSSSPYQLDMFSVFMEKASQLCRMKGYIGQIVPNVWLTNTYSSSTRSFIFSHANQLTITVPTSKVFPKLTVDVMIYSLQKYARPSDEFYVVTLKEGMVHKVASYRVVEYADGVHPISTSLNIEGTALVAKIKTNSHELSSCAKITRGVHPYRIGGYGQSAFVLGPQTARDVAERPYNSTEALEGYRAFIYGKDLHRFTPPVAGEYIKYGSWLAEPRQPSFFEGERVYSRKILGSRLVVTVETTNSVVDQQVYITKPTVALSAFYLAGVLGSKTIAFFIRTFYDEVNDAFPQIKVGQLQSLPIRTLDLSNPTEKAQHDQMVQLVQQMLDLKRQEATGTLDTVTRRLIERTDHEIDQLVYQLYGLTDEEIKIVEAATP